MSQLRFDISRMIVDKIHLESLVIKLMVKIIINYIILYIFNFITVFNC